jgi:hypothetical protein
MVFNGLRHAVSETQTAAAPFFIILPRRPRCLANRVGLSSKAGQFSGGQTAKLALPYQPAPISALARALSGIFDATLQNR